MAPRKLKPWVLDFLTEYLDNGNKHTPAVLKYRPKLTYQSAHTTGHRLLRNAAVKAQLDEMIRKRHVRQISSRDTLISEADEILALAKDNGSKGLTPALKAIELKGKLSGAFNTTEDDGNKLAGFLQKIGKVNNLQINVANSNTNNADTSADIPLLPTEN